MGGGLDLWSWDGRYGCYDDAAPSTCRRRGLVVKASGLGSEGPGFES